MLNSFCPKPAGIRARACPIHLLHFLCSKVLKFILKDFLLLRTYNWRNDKGGVKEREEREEKEREGGQKWEGFKNITMVIEYERIPSGKNSAFLKLELPRIKIISESESLATNF